MTIHYLHRDGVDYMRHGDIYHPPLPDVEPIEERDEPDPIDYWAMALISAALFLDAVVFLAIGMLVHG